MPVFATIASHSSPLTGADIEAAAAIIAATDPATTAAEPEAAMLDTPKPRRRRGPGAVDPASTALAPMATVPAPSDYQGNLNLHNSYRAQHQSTGPLVWDDVVAASALAYASQCKWPHDPANNVYGENLYVHSQWTNTVTQQAAGIKAW